MSSDSLTDFGIDWAIGNWSSYSVLYRYPKQTRVEVTYVGLLDLQFMKYRFELTKTYW